MANTGTKWVYLVTGNDDFAVKERAAQLADELCSGSAENSDGYVVVDASGTDNADVCQKVLSDFAGELQTPPFLTERKVVHLKHLTDFSALLSADLEDATAAGTVLKLLLTDSMPGVVALIDGSGFDNKRTFAKKLKTAGHVKFEEYQTVKSTDRDFSVGRFQQIRDFFRREKKDIEPAAVEFLAGAIANDQGTLRNELEKLLMSVGDATMIRRNDCLSIISRSSESMGWMLAGAAVRGDLPGALGELHKLKAQDEAPLRIFASLSNEFQNLGKMRAAMAELGISRVYSGVFDGISPEIRAAHPENPLLKLHPYRAYKLCESAIRWDGPQLARAYSLLLEANVQLVSGAEGYALLTDLMIRLCRRGGGESRSARG
ncbi:MAG: DNA polymerase III subunit delta [Victivallaceae bacterium]|nr:DNA polymerase III subunit delta [Victivallaceae bacterium]